ncbi:MAG: M28 family peptidase, partial [Pyrinomonadaceae bacterium]
MIVFVNFTGAQVAPGKKRPSPSSPSSKRQSTRSRSAPLNPQITGILRDIDARRIETTIRTLVSFGTRNSLSTQDDPKRGIGAARDWLFQEFKKLEPLSGGRLSVEQQSYVQPVAQRIPQPTKMTNIVATLKGTQDQSVERVYIVSGHYDSMCTSPTNSSCDAPGANDDASGTAAVLEMARVFATRKFDARIIFMAVAGEE